MFVKTTKECLDRARTQSDVAPQTVPSPPTQLPCGRTGGLSICPRILRFRFPHIPCLAHLIALTPSQPYAHLHLRIQVYITISKTCLTIVSLSF